MAKTNSETIVAKVNSNVFFKEFTFTKNDFKEVDSNQQLEFADNVVWLDELFFIYQIKEQGLNSGNALKWFEGKIQKRAVRQLKSTIKYISNHPEILIENEKGHKLDISKAKHHKELKKIIIYKPNEPFPSAQRYKKFYVSSEIGLVHLFHSEDYYWICKYLITPAEVNEYLDFREDLFQFNQEISNSLPEQYFLAHFLETVNADHFDSAYLTNLQNHNPDVDEFDVSGIIDNFNKNIKLINFQTEYYPIVCEIAKLKRSELVEFKKRLLLSIQNAENSEAVLPYRVYFPRTDCGFVFIPLLSHEVTHWKNALFNFTMGHKYDRKARKCIGVVVFIPEDQQDRFELFWQFAEEEWQYNEEMENLLSKSFPFREVKLKVVENRYKN